MLTMKLFFYLLVLSIGRYAGHKNEEKRLPTLCHVCKHTVDEFLNELLKSNSKDVLRLGQVLQSEEKHKTVVYKKSELRLIEALENTCNSLRNYKVHKDKPNNLRYSKDESATFKTLNELRGRGIKVDLGFPEEMWDTPDAEIVRLKTQCENLLEKYEDEIEEWYFDHQDVNLHNWLCRDQVLQGNQQDCLQVLCEDDRNKKLIEGKEEFSGQHSTKENIGGKMQEKENKFEEENVAMKKNENGAEIREEL